MNQLANTIAGASFGAALTASGVWSPSTIVAQMQLQDFHMLEVFMTASSASALAIHFLSRAGTCPKRPRSPSLLFTGLPYDGNIIGGAMLGMGMALTGACPGTVLVQVVTGTYPGMYSFIGGIAGGILYVPLQRYLRRSGSCKTDDESLWLDKKFHCNPNLAILAYETTCVAVVGAAMVLAPVAKQTFLPPIVGGALIGGAQLTSLLLRGSPVGISTAYEDVGAMVYGVFQKRNRPVKALTPAVVFAVGVMLGAAALVQLAPQFVGTATATDLSISPIRAVVGGVTMVFGARLAGGCTSGHGISGMSMLATSSVVTVASMFAGGISLAQLLW